MFAPNQPPPPDLRPPRVGAARADYSGDSAPEWMSDEMLKANMEDDVAGSGIFDEGYTTHRGDGVFADRWSMPGYAQREDGAGKSEVIDAQTETPIGVFLPGYWNGQAGMPSTQPRLPFPDPSQEYPDWAWLANKYDGNVPAQGMWDTGELHPQAVNQTMAETMARPIPQRNIFDSGLGSYTQAKAGLGEMPGMDMPLWQWALLGGTIGVLLAIGWHMMGDEGGANVLRTPRARRSQRRSVLLPDGARSIELLPPARSGLEGATSSMSGRSAFSVL